LVFDFLYFYSISHNNITIGIMNISTQIPIWYLSIQIWSQSIHILNVALLRSSLKEDLSYCSSGLKGSDVNSINYQKIKNKK